MNFVMGQLSNIALFAVSCCDVKSHLVELRTCTVCKQEFDVTKDFMITIPSEKPNVCRKCIDSGFFQEWELIDVR